jgi:hypothetical protein
MADSNKAAEAAKRHAAVTKYMKNRVPRRNRKQYSQALDRAAADPNVLQFHAMVAEAAKESLIWSETTKKRRIIVLQQFTNMYEREKGLEQFIGKEFAYEGLFGASCSRHFNL